MSSIESKRVQYRKYLERAGVIDALSKALIKLYEEQNKPDDAIRFVRKFMCEACPSDEDYDKMKADLEESKRQIEKLEQEVERLKSQIIKTPEEIREFMEAGFSSLTMDEDNKDSLLRKYLTRDVMDSLVDLITPEPVQANLYDCCVAGMTHHEAKVGIFAADAECYDLYNPLFDPIIRDYHEQLENNAEVLQKEPDWGNADEVENLDPEKKYIKSTRIRICRNLEGYPFFPKLKEKHYEEIEQKIRIAAEALDGELTGAYTRMGDLDADSQKRKVANGVLFHKNDEYLHTAGCFRFWPLGRGIYNNPAETFIIWVNRKDHMNVISMAQCGDLSDVYNRLVTGITAIEKNLTFARHKKYGFLTACPTDMGTTLRASVHIRLPLLSQKEDKLQELAKVKNLQIRGTSGDNTEIIDGVIDISNKRRMGFTEFELVKQLQEGVVALIKAEEELEAGKENE